MTEDTFLLALGIMFALTTVEVTLAWRMVRSARRAAGRHQSDALLWRAAAIDTATEWVRRERGEICAADFRSWANRRADVLLRDHLPAIAHKHAARWPSFPKDNRNSNKEDRHGC